MTASWTICQQKRDLHNICIHILKLSLMSIFMTDMLWKQISEVRFWKSYLTNTMELGCSCFYWKINSLFMISVTRDWMLFMRATHAIWLVAFRSSVMPPAVAWWSTSSKWGFRLFAWWRSWLGVGFLSSWSRCGPIGGWRGSPLSTLHLTACSYNVGNPEEYDLRFRIMRNLFRIYLSSKNWFAVWL